MLGMGQKVEWHEIQGREEDRETKMSPKAISLQFFSSESEY